ncbi:hypothetical protein FQR65_LT05439 [Abscondita terminalis]|nr:hypothetical protein FQR65_LT05439 [Abscondita terminalis]
MEEKRKAKNFTTFEKNLVVDLVQSKISILENKKTDTVSNEAKNQAWNSIAVAYNSSCQTGHRTPKQLKDLYSVLKRAARKNIATDRAEHFKSGGGIYTKTTSEIDIKIIEALPQQFEPDANAFDSSAPLFRDIQQSAFESPKQMSISYEPSEPSASSRPISCPSPTTPAIAVFSSSSMLPTLQPTPTEHIISCQLPTVPEIAVPSSSSSTLPTCQRTPSKRTVVSRKRKHPVDSLTEVIEKQKKLKYELYEAEMREKTKLIQEEREYKKQKHEMDMKIIQEELQYKREKQELDKKLLNFQLEEQNLKLEYKKLQVQMLMLELEKMKK